jgi:hypothetical protein
MTALILNDVEVIKLLPKNKVTVSGAAIVNINNEGTVTKQVIAASESVVFKNYLIPIVLEITALGDVTITEAVNTDPGGVSLPVGTAGAGVTVTHHGDGVNVTAVLTLTNIPLTVGTSEDLAVGSLIYTLPSGNITIHNSYEQVNLSGVTITTDTPDVGIGTVIGSGAVAVLGGTAEFENIQTGTAAPDTNGTDEIAASAAGLNILTAGAHTVYLNWADGWGANTDADGLVNGTVVLNYTRNAA